MMKPLKFPTLFAVAILMVSSFLLGLFIGRNSGDNTMYVVAESTLPPEVTEAPLESTAVDETPGKPEKIDLNTATVSELDSLPGIGEVIAKRIVEYREEYGSFITIEELQEVSGIGEALFEKIRDFVIVR